MPGGKDFVEKVYFKVVRDIKKPQLLNGNVNLLVTLPTSQSTLITTKETGHKFLKEKPDTIVTYIVYATNENPAVLGSSEIINFQTNIKEKDSFLSCIGTETLPGGFKIPNKLEFDSSAIGGSGRFKGAEKAKFIVRTSIEGNIRTATYDVTISGHR